MFRRGLLFAIATGSDIPLVTFDGVKATTHEWDEMNDPVMGGKSTGDFTIKDGFGLFHGEVVDVPRLKAPGFIKVSTPHSFFPWGKREQWPDISACTGLKLTVKSNTDYAGYRFSFSMAKAAGARFFLYGYKQDFAAPMNEFGDVVLPFNKFSDDWDGATGKQIKTCAEDKQYCPTKKDLQNIETMSFWGEGVGGKIDLQIKSIVATGCTENVLV